MNYNSIIKCKRIGSSLYNALDIYISDKQMFQSFKVRNTIESHLYAIELRNFVIVNKHVLWDLLLGHERCSTDIQSIQKLQTNQLEIEGAFKYLLFSIESLNREDKNDPIDESTIDNELENLL